MYQIYIDRGNGLELDGCWGSEHARFGQLADAEEALAHLEEQYPDSEFIIEEEY